MSKRRRPEEWDSIPGLSEQSHRFIENLQEETDRGVALVAAAFLDDVLTALLRSVFVEDQAKADKLLEYPGALSIFAARIDLAYMLGLFGPNTYSALNIVRDLRNRFAHTHELVTFDDPCIKQMCERMQVVPAGTFPIDLGPRDQFTTQIVILAQVLMAKGHMSKHLAAGTDPQLAAVVRDCSGTDQPVRE